METPKPIRARYLILRRNTGEFVLSTEADIRAGFGVSLPRPHDKYSCYAEVPKTGTAPSHEVFAGNWIGDVRQTETCRCACHTRKGVAEWRAAMKAIAAKRGDPATQKFEFEGGSSMGINLSRRVRRVASDTQVRLAQLDARIAKLQRERTALIPRLWGSGDVLTPADLAKIVATPPAKRLASIGTVKGAIEPKNTISPEGKAR